MVLRVQQVTSSLIFWCFLLLHSIHWLFNIDQRLRRPQSHHDLFIEDEVAQ